MESDSTGGKKRGINEWRWAVALDLGSSMKRRLLVDHVHPADRYLGAQSMEWADGVTLQMRLKKTERLLTCKQCRSDKPFDSASIHPSIHRDHTLCGVLVLPKQTPWLLAQSWMGRHSDIRHQQDGTHFDDLGRMTGWANPHLVLIQHSASSRDIPMILKSLASTASNWAFYIIFWK